MEICRQVSEIHSHFTEDQLRDTILETHPSIPRELILKTLEEMVKAGLIRKILFANHKIFYEHVWGHLHHDHLWCMECHKVIEFQDDQIDYVQQRAAQENDFYVLRHQLQVVGLCSECKKKTSLYDLEPQKPKEPTMPLAMVPDGKAVKIAEILGGRGMRMRLSRMGLVKGETINVVQNRFAGPFIIDVKGTRLMLAHRFAHHILVENL